MIDNQVNHELHVALFQLSNEFINIAQSAVAGVNILVIGLTNLSVSGIINCGSWVKFTISKIQKSVQGSEITIRKGIHTVSHIGLGGFED